MALYTESVSARMHTFLRFSLAAAIALPLVAGTIDVRVQDGRGRAVRDAVVYAVPEGRQLPPSRKSAVMDQKNRMFIPHVLPIQTGTAVRFPNSDDIRHHVYSFSPAKQFQLPLYKGNPANPEVFDRPGVATLGCNIHDQMSAFIVVVDTPYFEKTGPTGRVTLRGLDPGRYSVHLWYPDMRDEPAPKSITLTSDARVSASFVTGRAAVKQPPDPNHAHAHP
jgi:plastocyanin